MIPLPIHYVELEAIFAHTRTLGARTVALTCAEGGEGVSTIAYALARRAAAGGLRALLVDLNLAAPAAASRLALTAKPWEPGADHLPDAIHTVPSIGLSILPAPVGQGQSWSFRDADMLKDMMTGLRQRFDFVVVDTSPVNRRNKGNIPTEGICAASDATLMVVLAGRTTESQLAEAQQRLSSAGVRLAGAILNDRFMPPLASELTRETRRLDKYFPTAMERIRRWISQSILLNQEI